jgi:hypothetical protein
MDIPYCSNDRQKHMLNAEKSRVRLTPHETSVSVERILFIIPYMGLETASYLTFQLSRSV